MAQMPIIGLLDEARRLAESGQRVSVLWQKPDSLVFIARGREYRSEFHIHPSDEMMYMIKGEMRLHYRTADGKEEVAVIPEGAMIYTPAGTPHSPPLPARRLRTYIRAQETGRRSRSLSMVLSKMRQPF